MEKAMATHSSILAWRVPWTEEPGGVHGVAKSQTWLSDFTALHVLNCHMSRAASFVSSDYCFEQDRL